MKLALTFPGQGSQAIGMLGDLAAACPEVGRTFEAASDALGYDLWDLVCHGPEQRLKRIRQQGRIQPASRPLHIRTHLEQGMNLERLRIVGQGLLVHQLRADTGQESLVTVRELVEQVFRDGDTGYGVSEKLEAFVRLQMVAAGKTSERGMAERTFIELEVDYGQARHRGDGRSPHA